jgi:steroid delta-isomerase-like uncharacterized protein
VAMMRSMRGTGQPSMRSVPPDIVLHNASMTIQGYPAYKQFISMYFTAFPDLHITIEDMIAEGDTVVVRTTFHGTHKGDLMSIPPTGKQATTTGISIFRVANGKALEHWANSDDLGLLQQLGVIPAMGERKKTERGFFSVNRQQRRGPPSV